MTDVIVIVCHHDDDDTVCLLALSPSPSIRDPTTTSCSTGPARQERWSNTVRIGVELQIVSLSSFSDDGVGSTAAKLRLLIITNDPCFFRFFRERRGLSKYNKRLFFLCRRAWIRSVDPRGTRA